MVQVFARALQHPSSTIIWKPGGAT
jgi:hypothetical protein